MARRSVPPAPAHAPLSFPVPPEGLIVELVTPLTDDGRLDREGLDRLLKRVVPGADGLLAGSPAAGEALDLDPETRLELLQHLLPALDGRLPVFFGITANSWEETRDLALAAKGELQRRPPGAPVFLADLPLWYHSNRGLPQACQRLLADAALPLVLLNLPEVVHRRAPLFKHRNIRTQVMKKLAPLPGVVGLIYRGEMRRFLNYHYAVAARPGFAFYEADEVNFLTRPGAWGVLSAGAQLLPAAWQKVTRACLHPEEAVEAPEERLEIWDLSQRLIELAKVYRPQPAALLKAALAAQGTLGSAVTASGTAAASPTQQEDLLALLAVKNR